MQARVVTCAILLQRQADNKMHPIMYFSKRTTETESSTIAMNLKPWLLFMLLNALEYICKEYNSPL